MTQKTNQGRRRAMQLLAGAAGLAGFGRLAQGSGHGATGALIPGRGWVTSSGQKCEGDGTPLQFIPRTPPDDEPLKNELEKYPRCPYCGMSRRKWHHSRHLVQYDDGLVDGTCSIHCLAISLSLNIDRGPKAIYAADYGSADRIKPLMKVDDATYLVGSSLRGTMTANSKMAFASERAARLFQSEKGGDLTDFDHALTLAYVGMAKDTIAIRKRRAERRRRMMMKKKG